MNKNVMKEVIGEIVTMTKQIVVIAIVIGATYAVEATTIRREARRDATAHAERKNVADDCRVEGY